MNHYYPIYNENLRDDTIVRSLRAFGMMYSSNKNENAQDEMEKMRAEFLSNGSQPIDIEETIFQTKLLETTNISINNGSLNSDLYKKLTNKDNTFTPMYNNNNKKSPINMKKCDRRSISQSIIENRCVFCSNNNEPLEVVRSHSVRDIFGRVLCPKLRTYVCPICNSSGDSAHTVKYCPKKTIITMEMLENKCNELLKKREKFR